MELMYGIGAFVVTVLCYVLLFTFIYKGIKNKENAEELEKLVAQISYIPTFLITISVYVIIDYFGSLDALKSIILFYLIIMMVDKGYYHWSKNDIELERKIALFYIAMLLWLVYLLAEIILGTDPLKYTELLVDTLGVVIGLVISVDIVLSGDNIKEKRRQIWEGVYLNQLFASKVWFGAVVIMGVFLVGAVKIGTFKEEYKGAVSIGFLLASIMVALVVEFRRRKKVIMKNKKEAVMAEIKNFIYCLKIDTKGGRTDVIGLFNVMTPKYIPGLFSFSINFWILNITEGEHMLNINFMDPDKNVIAQIDNMKIQYKKNESCELPEDQIGASIVVRLQNVDIKKAGLYSTEVILDGNNIGKYDVFVKENNGDVQK